MRSAYQNKVNTCILVLDGDVQFWSLILILRNNNYFISGKASECDSLVISRCRMYNSLSVCKTNLNFTAYK